MTDTFKFKEDLSKYQEFKLIYSGPTFETGVKIDLLIDNLKSIKELIYTITDVNSEYKKGRNTVGEIREIKIIPKKGSLEEEIIILFSNPEIRSAVISLIVSFFFYILAKHDSKKSTEEIKEHIDRIEDLIIRNQLKNIKKLYAPLEQKNDNLKLIENNEVKFEVNYYETDSMNKSIQQIETEIHTEETIEHLEGYISAIDIDTERLKFHSTSMDKAYPLVSSQSNKKILPLIGKQLKAKMKVTKFKDRIRRFELLDYTIIQSDLNEFTK